MREGSRFGSLGRLTAALVVVAGVGGLGGCGISDAVAGCGEAPASAVDDATRQALSDELAGERRVDKVEVLDSSTIDIPDGQRQYGAERLLALAVEATFGDDATPSFPGVLSTALFALDADGALIGPVNPIARTLFRMTDPDDAGWSAWSQEVSSSSAGRRVRGCVD